MWLRSLALVFVAHCLLVVADGEKKLLNELNLKCREENNLREEEVVNLDKTRHLDTRDERVKCFVKCVLTGLTLMNEEGDFILEDGPEEGMNYKKHFEHCRDVSGTNTCDKALNFQNCLWKQINIEEESSE